MVKKMGGMKENFKPGSMKKNHQSRANDEYVQKYCKNDRPQCFTQNGLVNLDYVIIVTIYQTNVP